MALKLKFSFQVNQPIPHLNHSCLNQDLFPVGLWVVCFSAFAMIADPTIHIFLLNRPEMFHCDYSKPINIYQIHFEIKNNTDNVYIEDVKYII
jgi:hypothetical protein